MKSSIYCRLWLFFLSASLISHHAIAADKTPVTPSGISYLDLCLPPNKILTKTPVTISEQAHCKLEDIIIQAYRQAFMAHKVTQDGWKLLNSDLNGHASERGQNLLTFSAMNGFRRLAVWGLMNGADIYRQDSNSRSMLSTAIDHKLNYMVRFSLQHGAGQAPLRWSYSSPTNMKQTMDRYIRYYMKNTVISAEEMNAFEIHGRRFEHFLAINGFSESLRYRLHYDLSKEQALNRIINRDMRGYDVLQTAIMSLDYRTVQTVLMLSNYTVNHRIPLYLHYDHPGDRPLNTAQRLNASPELIQLLIRYDADPYRR